jgi:hypothetical protein
MVRAVRQAWRMWKRIGRKIGDVQARLLLTGLYFVILGPFAIAMRWTSDPLTMKVGSAHGWQLRTERGMPAERARQQF